MNLPHINIGGVDIFYAVTNKFLRPIIAAVIVFFPLYTIAAYGQRWAITLAFVVFLSIIVLHYRSLIGA